ncbi:MAG: flagellar type III secretion system pore protein FliP [Gammaproteobacteria bacterium]|nr:flagellar type III secretion system pore protein FliP [Gammaproteobacteria bacterium]
MAFAADQIMPALTVTSNDDGSQTYSVTLQILALMTALTFIPAALIMMTSFTRIIIVLAIVRQALGLPTTPSNQTIIGLSLFLTIFIMMPVFERINETALQPYINEQLALQDAALAATKPLKQFMLGQTRNDDLALFVRMSGSDGLESRDNVPLQVLIPAFVTSELKTAFQIGFLLFIPFLIIDLVVASVLMSMGMMMLSPMIISLPFKIMLFVLVDGWNLIIGTLATSFYVQ